MKPKKASHKAENQISILSGPVESRKLLTPTILIGDFSDHEQAAAEEVIGSFDVCNEQHITGWLTNRHKAERLTVEVLVDNIVVAERQADQIRLDVERLSLAHGLIGFTIDTPSVLFDGAQHTISLREKATKCLLHGSEKHVKFCTQEREDPNESAAIEIMRLIFDSNWYARENADVARAAIDPFSHYMSIGYIEGRDPSPLFFAKWYTKKYPECEDFNVSPLEHYVRHGAALGHEPNSLFDSSWYQSQHPGVEIGNPLAHYIKHGAVGGHSPHPLFDTRWYQVKNPDIPLSWIDPLAHYLRHGHSEFREPNQIFDTKWYLENTPDALRYQGPAIEHYLAMGISQDCSPHPLFDSKWYAETYPNAKEFPYGPFAHYVQIGFRANFDPNPLFDSKWYRLQQNIQNDYDDAALSHYWRNGCHPALRPNPLFDTNAYLTAYPYIRQAAINPLEHYLRFPFEYREYSTLQALKSGHLSTAERIRKDVSERTQMPTFVARSLKHGFYRQPGTATAAVAAALAVEQLSQLDSELKSSVSSSTVLEMHHCTGLAADRKYAAWRKLFCSLPVSINRIVFVPWLTLGGADLVAVNSVKAAQDKFGKESVLLLATDHAACTATHWLTPGTHFRSLAAIDPNLSSDEKVEIVATLIHALQPKSVLNVNSHAAWEAIAQYGKPISTFTEIFAYFFCRDYDKNDKPDGYADKYFRICLPFMSRIYFDNAKFLDELRSEYYLTDKDAIKLRLAYQPIVHTARKSATTTQAQDFTVLWAGRNARQKNPELLLEIIRACPEIKFEIYGDFTNQFLISDGRPTPGNATLKGTFKTFSDLPLQTYGAFLFTSLWEGIPTMLINTAAAGLPIVASSVGGIPELIKESTGWPISNIGEAELYVSALRKVRDDPKK